MPEFSALSPPPENTTARELLAKLNPSDPTFIKAPLQFDAVAVGFVYLANQKDSITAVKNTVLATTDEITETNASIDNWRVRKEILLSKWPTDPGQLDALIAALQADAAVPPPPLPADSSTGTPGLQLASVAEINASKARAQTILDLLTADQADADAGRSLPTAPLSSTGDGVLNAAVGDWLQAQGLDFSKDTWDSALLPDGNGGYATFSKASLETPWTFSVPGVLSTPVTDQIAPNGVKFIATADGTITPAPAVRVTDNIENMKAAGYDLTFVPSYIREPSGGPLLETEDREWDLYTVGSTTYVALTPETVSDIKTGVIFVSDLTRVTALKALYGQLLPDQKPVNKLGVNYDDTLNYWSDGSTIYRFDYGVDADGDPNMLNFANTTLHVTPPYTGAQLAAQWRNASVVQTVSRLPQASDMDQMANAATAILAKLGNNSSQWASIADAQKLQLNESITLYSNACNWITNLLERLERSTSNQIQKLF